MRFRPLILLAALALVGFAGTGCRSTCTTTRVTGCQPPAAPPAFALHLTDWRSVAAANPMAPTDNIVVTPMGHTAEASHHLVRVRDREPIHYHATHDLTVFVLSGTGRILLDTQEVPCMPGEVLHIPRGQVHSFINAGKDIAVAYVIFTPPMDGPDRVIVPAPAAKL